MIASQNGCAFAAQREACVLTTYPDGDGFSQGFGIFGAQPGDTKSFEECIALYVERCAVADADVAAVFAGVPFTQTQYDSVWETTYNIGRTQLLKETGYLSAIESFAADPTNHDLQDDVAIALTKVKYRPGYSGRDHHNLARKMSSGALFLRGDYGDLTFVKLWTEEKVPGVHPPLLVKMPRFR